MVVDGEGGEGLGTLFATNQQPPSSEDAVDREISNAVSYNTINASIQRKSAHSKTINPQSRKELNQGLLRVSQPAPIPTPRQLTDLTLVMTIAARKLKSEMQLQTIPGVQVELSKPNKKR